MSEKSMEPIELDHQKEYTFHPDSAIKKFLTEISTARLIGILNGILETNYPTDCAVNFGSTEFFTITGNLDKSSRRCDLVVDIKDMKEEHSKTLVELQSSRDKTMGFRMFVYALNVSEEEKSTQTYTLPHAVTIYTTLDVPQKGMDQATFVSSKGEKLFTFEVPFYNVLATDFEEFQDSPLELLKLLYLYRYRKDPKLLKNTEELKRILNNLQDFALKEEGSDRLVICGLLADMLVDVAGICKKEQYWKELEIMENMNKTYSQMLIEKSEARGKREGKLEEKLEIAEKLLDILDNSIIAMKTGLPLSQIEELRANS